MIHLPTLCVAHGLVESWDIIAEMGATAPPKSEPAIADGA